MSTKILLPQEGGDPLFMPDKAQDVFKEAMGLLFHQSESQEGLQMEDLVSQVQALLEEEEDASTSTLACKELNECFNACNQETQTKERLAEFRFTEDFILQEQNARRDRQVTAQKLEATEEKRLAAEVAQLKGLRLKSLRQGSDEELRWKIADAERAYTSRKMVYAKAAQVAGAELRLQFSRVRTFLENLHHSRQDVLYKQHFRSLAFQTLLHALQKTDPRVISLDKQIALRLYRKKKADLNEFHMQRTLEEAVFLESMMDVLDQVQKTKEAAARDMFDLRVRCLKQERDNNQRRQDEIALFEAAGTLEMAKLVAQYTLEDQEDQMEEQRTDQKVEAMERSKHFDASNDKHVNTTKLYDTILWGVVSNDLGLTTTGSSLYSSDFGSDIGGDPDDHEEEDEDEESKSIHNVEDDHQDPFDDDMDEDGDGDPTTNSEQSRGKECLTPAGTMHARQLARELRKREKALLKKHKKELRAERQDYQQQAKALQAKHQAIIDDIVQTSVTQKDALREAIDERLDLLAKQQEESTNQMQKSDLQLMKDALLAEDQRVEEAEANSFRKAQELISAQVFHEVRNALSSVIAMSEMTTTLKSDSSMTPKELVGSVDDMLDQIGDVVNYALKMLNEILDVSKINSGAFMAKKEAFDLQDVVARATRMQQAKASQIGMAFYPLEKPCIAVSDSGIVERVVATMISNAVKFTQNGAVQPFVWPLERMPPKINTTPVVPEHRKSWIGEESSLMSSSCSRTSTSSTSTNESDNLSNDGSCSTTDNNMLMLEDPNMRLYAVGVADTGCGLSDEKLQAAKLMISTSTSGTSTHGAQNTGFGLYHAHLQAKALNTQLATASVGDCLHLLGKDMLSALQNKKSEDGANAPGPGSVIYLTVPVYEDGASAAKVLRKQQVSNKAMMIGSSDYTFQPLPSPLSKDGCFRVLVADDVLMLRKGVVHTIGKLWTQRFPYCPISVSTACTAEDMLRVVGEEAFDLVICDHHFNYNHDTTPRILAGHPAAEQRPQLSFDESNSAPDSMRKTVREFFENERFTGKEEDGKVLGLDALIQLATSKSLCYPTPVLMLVSGHKVEVDPSLGIVVAQKPLKSHEFITTLEKNASRLLSSGSCQFGDESQENEEPVVQNSRGSWLFVKARNNSPGAPQGNKRPRFCSPATGA